MTTHEFHACLNLQTPPQELSAPLAALWWDAHRGWENAHDLVDALETPEAMAVHAYLHRKEGAASNANYWYDRASRTYQRDSLEDEWEALVDALCSQQA